MVVILLADGFEEVEALAPADILRRMGLSVVLAGISGRQVTGAHGIVITADKTLNQIKKETHKLKRVSQTIDKPANWRVISLIKPKKMV